MGAVLGAMFVFHPTWGAAIGARQLRSIPEPLTSRVQSAIVLVALGAVPFAQLVTGGLLQALGPAPTILLLGAVILVVLGAALLSRSLREHGPRPPLADLAPAAARDGQ